MQLLWTVRSLIAASMTLSFLLFINGPWTILCRFEYVNSEEGPGVSSKEDAANNFTRGHYTVGKEIIDNCDNVQGCIINHSIGGDTASGLDTLILERIAVDYRNKSKVCDLFIYITAQFSILNI